MVKKKSQTEKQGGKQEKNSCRAVLGVPLCPRNSLKALPAAGVALIEVISKFFSHIIWGFVFFGIKKNSTGVERGGVVE